MRDVEALKRMISDQGVEGYEEVEEPVRHHLDGVEERDEGEG